MDDSDREMLARIRRADRKLARMLKDPGVPRRLSGAYAARFEARRLLIDKQAHDLVEGGAR
jgi:hypothetical protein